MRKGRPVETAGIVAGRVRRAGGTAGVAGAILLLSACGPGAPTVPPPLPPPPVESAAPTVAGETDRLGWPAPPLPDSDEILDSPMLRHPGFQAEVDRWVTFWRTRGAAWFPEYLERMSWFAPAVDEALAEAGLPASLRYLPIVESGYSPRAVSSARAVGLWQLMAPTARQLGVGVSRLVDERRDPFRSTEAATTFLAELHARFGSWFLALSAYNAGPGRVQRILNRHAPLRPRTDSLWWEIRPHLPRETRDFVPKLFAAARIAAAPDLHGFSPLPEPRDFAFEEVEVPDATTLDVVARAAESPQAEIERLNPQVVRGITPAERPTTLRVPPGKGEIFRRNYARIPPSERVTFVEHRVRSGETLTHIAVRYGIRLRELEAANPTLRPRYLQIGQRIVVPVAPSALRQSGG